MESGEKGQRQEKIDRKVGPIKKKRKDSPRG